MNHHFLKFPIFLLAIFSVTANAEIINKQDIPEKVFNYIYKKHPKAQDFKIEEKVHFGQPLYEVTFTADQLDKNNQVHEEKFAKLFRVNGHFFTNAIAVDNHSFNIIPDVSKKTLQLRYPNYEILALKLVNNPNTVGEEYEANLLVSGEIWNISFDNHGELISETKQSK